MNNPTEGLADWSSLVHRYFEKSSTRHHDLFLEECYREHAPGEGKVRRKAPTPNMFLHGCYAPLSLGAMAPGQRYPVVPSWVSSAEPEEDDLEFDELPKVKPLDELLECQGEEVFSSVYVNSLKGTLHSCILQTPTRSQQQDRINNLPTEVLVHIFQIAQPNPCFNTCHSTSTSVSNLVFSAVCRQWRQVVQSTPALWSIICVTPTQIEMGFLYLRHSQLHPLEVHLDIGVAHTACLLNQLLPSAARWRRLHLQSTINTDRYLLHLLDALDEESQLEMLSVNTSHERGLNSINVDYVEMSCKVKLRLARLKALHFAGTRPLPLFRSGAPMSQLSCIYIDHFGLSDHQNQLI